MKISIFDYNDYRSFVRNLIKTFPKAGHGQFRKFATALRTNTVTVSQIFSGKRELSPEQALDLADYLGLTPLEKKYFLLLVQKERSSYYRLQSYLDEELQTMKRQARNLKSILSPTKELGDEAKAIFYSDWAYTAVRLFCSISKRASADSIASHLQISMARASKILKFLTAQGLLIEKGGKYSVGIASTHLDAQSPLVKSRQISWRIKATEYMDTERFPMNLFYTGPCTLSEDDFHSFRAELIELIQKLVKRVETTKPEKIACFNLDFFSIEK